MQIIISKTVVEYVQLKSQHLACIITGDKPDNVPAAISDVTDYANVSLVVADENVVIEVNDELFFKYMHMYLKVARLVAPFVKPLMSLFETIKDDVAEIDRFINQKK